MSEIIKKKEGKLLVDFDNITNEDVVFLRVLIEKELKSRKIKFTVGNVGETLAVNFFNDKPGLPNLQKAPNGTKNVDALSRDGERYSIKTIKEGGKTGTVYPDSKNQRKHLFEFILVVQINDDFKLKSLYRFSWKQFLKVRQWDKTMNAWYIPKTQKALNIGERIYEDSESS